MEVIFLALDRPEDVKKLLSLRTNWYMGQRSREIPKSLLLMRVLCELEDTQSAEMVAYSWSGVICDTNAPEEDHWWAIMAGEVPVPDQFH